MSTVYLCRRHNSATIVGPASEDSCTLCAVEGASEISPTIELLAVQERLRDLVTAFEKNPSLMSLSRYHRTMDALEMIETALGID